MDSEKDSRSQNRRLDRLTGAQSDPHIAAAIAKMTIAIKAAVPAHKLFLHKDFVLPAPPALYNMQVLDYKGDPLLDPIPLNAKMNAAGDFEAPIVIFAGTKTEKDKEF